MAVVQLNLLPDVKTKFIKAQRSKHTVVLASIVISGAALGIVLLLATVVYGAQKIQLNNLNDDITSKSEQLKKVENLDKILTVQNQLKELPALHEGKPVVSRLFVYLPQIVPSDVNVSTYNMKFEDNTMTFSGTAKNLIAVNKFVDTLKFTKFTTDQSSDEKNAFSEVVLASFGRNDVDASYNVTLKYDPALFSSEYKTVTLVVPKITSTRSEQQSPTTLFKAPAEEAN